MLSRRSATAAQLTLRQIGPEAILDLVAGWRPESSRRARWKTYAELLAEYRLVRDEFLARPRAYGADLFAETFHRRMLARPNADPETVGQRLYWDWSGHASDD
jgi:hypothetical protein